jgi:hypothetical protein
MTAADLMARYMDPNGGCFDADALVSVPGGARRRAGDLRRGDTVETPAGPATILTVLHTHLREGVDLIRLLNVAGGEKQKEGGGGGGGGGCGPSSSLVVTPYHPVRARAATGECDASAAWAFPLTLPADAAAPFKVAPGGSPFLVVDFVLDRGHEVTVNGVRCITLAHGVEDDPVAAHAFFGTGECVRALGRLRGYEDGLVVIGPNGGVMRDRATGLIVDYAQVE